MDLPVNQIICGDCLEVMPLLPDKSIDMILCDLPYGTTACKWDTIIPFEPLWKQYERVIKDNGAIVLFGTEPFSSYLRTSNINLYKYDWKWRKNKVGNVFNCKNSPLKIYEDIIVFSKGSIANGAKLMMQYYPQGLIECNANRSNKRTSLDTTIGHRPSRQNDYNQKFTNYPLNILEFNSETGFHPTQKPVALFEYLIRTYTNEGEIVLDNCIGSGTTAIAALNTGRFFIGIEKEPKYVEIARQRLEQAQAQQSLFAEA